MSASSVLREPTADHERATRDGVSARNRARETLISAFLFVAALHSPGTASAQCTFDLPAKANALKTTLVRGYEPCPGSVHTVPNTETIKNVPACTAPAAGPNGSSYRFGEKGGCTAKISRRVEAPCTSGSGNTCSNLRVQAKCSGITEANGTTPIIGNGWELRLSLRTTGNDPENGDMTLIDLLNELGAAVRFGFEPAKKGKLRLKGDYVSDGQLQCVGQCSDNGEPCHPEHLIHCADPSTATCGPGNCTEPTLPAIGAVEFPACTNIEILDMFIVDPDGKVFARPGLGGKG